MFHVEWRKVQYGLCRANNLEFSIGMGNRRLVFFNVGMQSSLLIRKTVQACLFQGNSAKFSVTGIQAVFPSLVFTVLC